MAECLDLISSRLELWCEVQTFLIILVNPAEMFQLVSGESDVGLQVGDSNISSPTSVTNIDEIWPLKLKLTIYENQ